VSAPAARLIYHPRREFRRFGGTAVYFDSTSGNQDPYVWNDVFLHSYCHITQFRAEVGDINVWVSGDRFPEFRSLYCDLVFVVARKCPWTDANDPSRHDPIVDSDEAWADHYRWYTQHPLSLDPPAIPGGAFLARFLPEEFSLVNRGVVALPPALCAACP
jgi:hypothetical protein